MTARRLFLLLALGAAFAYQAAPAGASDHSMRVKEISVSDNGSGAQQFIELKGSSNEPFPPRRTRSSSTRTAATSSASRR